MEHEKNPSSKRPPPPILERFRSRLKDMEKNGPLRTLELVRVYEEVLVELTTNSKPVITELSMIAGVHKEHADGIAMAICDRILKVPVEQKLPSLYLLDSIVKNVGHDYLRYFAARLPQVFLETHKNIKPSSHPALLRLFKTWPPYFPSTVLSKIEVFLQENKKTSYSGDLRHSGSQSPCLLHSAHVNPEYLEGHHHFEHSALDAQHTKPPPSLQSYIQKSFKYGEMDLDHHDLLPPCPAFERIGTAAMGGVENMLPHLRPSSPSRIRSKVDTFPQRVADKSSLPGFGSGRPSDQNGGLARNWFSGDVAQNAEASLACNHDNGCDILRARLLIDAYGSKDTSHERLPKFQRLDFNDRSSVMSIKDTRSSEEEFVWESMSPTLGSQNQQNIPTSFGRNTILARPNAAYLRKDFGSDWHNQNFLPRSDDPANNITNSCRTFSDKFQDDVESHKEPIQQHQSSCHAREPLTFSNVFLQTSQQTTIPRSQGKLLQMRYSVSGTASMIAQKKSCSFDNACQADLPFKRISSRHSDSLKGEASALEMHLAQKSHTTILWPLVHKSQPPLPTAALHQQIRSPFDSESTETIESPMPNRPLFLHSQQLNADDRMKLNSISSQNSGFSLNRESLQQTNNLPLESHESQEISAPLATAPVSPHLGHNSFHGQDQEAVISPKFSNLTSEITPPIHPSLQSSVHSFRPLHLPPLGPALPPLPTAAPLPAASAASPPAPAPLPPPTVAAAATPLPSPCHPVFPPPPPHPMLLPPHPVPHCHDSVPRFFNPVPSLSLFATNSHSVPILPPPVPTQNNSFTFMCAPCGPLPLCPGPLPAPSQIRPASQSTNTVISESPANAYSALISSLMAQGLISLVPPNPPQDAVGIGFNAEFLKVRHESSINALYGDLSRQCTTCGMRFKSQGEHSNHMIWHVTKNQIAKNQKHKPSRHWYVSAKDWLSGAEALGTDAFPGFVLTESVTERKEDKEVVVPVDEDQSKCALCEEPFEYFYSDEMEEWLYRGAVYINAPKESLECIESSKLGPIVHAMCLAGNNGSGKT